MGLGLIDSRMQVRFIWGVIVCVIWVVAFIFFSYKEEKLICNVSENSCVVERSTYYFTKSSNFVIDPHEVKDVIVSGKKIYRRRHRDRYVYRLLFVDLNDKRSVIFYNNYKSYSRAQAKADEIKTKFREGNNIIEVTR